MVVVAEEQVAGGPADSVKPAADSDEWHECQEDCFHHWCKLVDNGIHVNFREIIEVASYYV